MDTFFITHRDPLFGIIIFFALISIISFANFWWGIFAKKGEQNRIDKFIKKFEQIKNYDDFTPIFKNDHFNFESIVLLGISFSKNGDYEKAINIFLSLLEIAKNKEQKEIVLPLLGKTYFKAGFLQRSKDIFLETLKNFPKNKDALLYLCAVYEKLREFKEAIFALESLEELGVCVEDQKKYLQTLSDLKDGCCGEEYEKNLLDAAKTSKTLQRLYIQRFLQQNLDDLGHLNIDYEKIKFFDFKNIIDLLWEGENLSKLGFKEIDIDKNSILIDIFEAKKQMQIPIRVTADKNSENSDNNYTKNGSRVKIFELEVLKELNKGNKNLADLGFEYVCSKCKNIFPIYFARCPNCLSYDCANIQTILIQKQNSRIYNEKNITF